MYPSRPYKAARTFTETDYTPERREPIVYAPQVQPPPLEFKGELDKWYQTTRNSVTTHIFLVDVRVDTIYYKNNLTDKHVNNMSLAKFLKYYVIAA